MKRIGIDARFFTDKATGIGKHVYELVQNLNNFEPEFHYTIFLNAEQFESFKLPGPNFKKVLSPFHHYSLSEQTSFCRQLNRAKFDLMVFPHFNAPILYKGKFVVTIHDLTLHHYPGKKKNKLHHRLAYKTLIKSVTKRAEHCFAVSENTKEDMINLLDIPEKKITVCYNGISRQFHPLTTSDEIRWPSVEQRYELPAQYFLYTGVLRSHKNILGLVQAYALFKQHNYKLNIKLVIAGPRDRIYLDEIIEHALKLNLTINGEDDITVKTADVFFPGFIASEDMNLLIGKAKAYVFPSFYEGFGIPPIEAMQCHTPVASSNTSSLPEACGEAALYFDPHDIEEIAYALEKIILDGDLRKKLINAGINQCEKFSWETMAKQMLEKYVEILF